MSSNCSLTFTFYTGLIRSRGAYVNGYLEENACVLGVLRGIEVGCSGRRGDTVTKAFRGQLTNARVK